MLMLCWAGSRFCTDVCLACIASCVMLPPCPRAVILLESNLGMSELEEMLSQLGDRSKVGGSGTLTSRCLLGA